MLNSAELAQLSWAWKKFQNFISIFKIYKRNKFHAQLSWAWKQFYYLVTLKIVYRLSRWLGAYTHLQTT